MPGLKDWVLKGVAGAVLSAGSLIAQGAAAQDGYKWPDYFNVVTPIVGAANHSLAVAWTSEFSATTGGRARVLPATNGYTRAAWLNTDQGRLTLVQASDYFDQMDAKEGYATKDAGPTDTRLLNINLVTGWGYFVRGDSGLKAFTDITPQTRVAFSPSSAFLVSGIDALLAYNGIDRNEATLIEVGNYNANTAAVTEGRADVAFTSPISGSSYEAEANPNGLRWLPLPKREDNPEAYKRYRVLQPGYLPKEVEAGVTSAKDVYMDHAYQANHVRADEDPEFVYQLVKWMDENHDSYKDDFQHAHMMSIDNLVAFLELGALQPLHEGVIRYLEEKGLWKPEYQARQDKLVEMAKKQEAGFKAAVAAAEELGITLEPGNEEWLAFWDKYRADNGLPASYGEAVLALGE